MFEEVDTKNVAAVGAAVTRLYQGAFPKGDPGLVGRIFECVIRCFRGDCPEYLPIDTRYHDLEHTLQGTLCMVRMLAARHRVRAEPVLDQHYFECGLLAILLHDTGYAKRRDDTVGTGAKYTYTHVERSARFAADLLGQKGFETGEIRAVQNMIRCTGVNARMDLIPFRNDVERMVGCALATADLLGQMAASDYLDKLPALYEEFAEAARCSGTQPVGGTVFASAEELLRKTPHFWQHYVRPRLESEFRGLYRFLADPYPDGPNEYMDRIESNIERIRRLYGTE